MSLGNINLFPQKKIVKTQERFIPKPYRDIAAVEGLRAELIIEIGENIQVENGINSVADLLRIMNSTTHESEHRYLEKFNNLLIDIIEKIQEQNKRNQIFINKALISLKDIRLEAMGTKTYQTYDKNGSSQQAGSRIYQE